jgi:hypothetical protein
MNTMLTPNERKVSNKLIAFKVPCVIDLFDALQNPERHPDYLLNGNPFTDTLQRAVKDPDSPVTEKATFILREFSTIAQYLFGKRPDEIPEDCYSRTIRFTQKQFTRNHQDRYITNEEGKPLTVDKVLPPEAVVVEMIHKTLSRRRTGRARSPKLESFINDVYRPDPSFPRSTAAVDASLSLCLADRELGLEK